MSKIIDEAKPIAEGKKIVVYMDVRRTARRTMLLEKRGRYLMAALKLIDTMAYYSLLSSDAYVKGVLDSEYECTEHRNSFRDDLHEKTKYCRAKAAELYRQAEEI